MVMAIHTGTEHYWLGWVIGSLFFSLGLAAYCMASLSCLQGNSAR
jgi:hypothetical protein